MHFGKSLTTPPLHERLRPHLERLSSLVHETVHIATLVGTTVHHQDAIVATDHALVLTSRIGKRLPAHLASSGTVMLADLDPAVVNARYAPTDGGSLPRWSRSISPSSMTNSRRCAHRGLQPILNPPKRGSSRWRFHSVISRWRIHCAQCLPAACPIFELAVTAHLGCLGDRTTRSPSCLRRR